MWTKLSILGYLYFLAFVDALFLKPARPSVLTRAFHANMMRRSSYAQKSNVESVRNSQGAPKVPEQPSRNGQNGKADFEVLNEFQFQPRSTNIKEATPAILLASLWVVRIGFENSKCIFNKFSK